MYRSPSYDFCMFFCISVNLEEVLVLMLPREPAGLLHLEQVRSQGRPVTWKHSACLCVCVCVGT